jgi:hypothetical protein
MCERAIRSIAQGPEEMFYQARHLAYLAEGARSIEAMRRAVEEGFFCYAALACDPWLDAARRLPECGAILEEDARNIARRPEPSSRPAARNCSGRCRDPRRRS